MCKGYVKDWLLMNTQPFKDYRYHDFPTQNFLIFFLLLIVDSMSFRFTF